MGERYYEAELGRFTQVDPIEGGSRNAYDYAFQDPMTGATRRECSRARRSGALWLA